MKAIKKINLIAFIVYSETSGLFLYFCMNLERRESQEQITAK